MENKESIFSFNFDDTSRDHIKTISKWAGINAVLSLIGLGINVIQFIMAAGSPYRTSGSGLNFGMRSENGLTLFFQVCISLLLNFTLLAASKYLKKGIDDMDPASLTKGLGSLRTYYKIYGIVVIVLIVLGFLAIAFISSFTR